MCIPIMKSDLVMQYFMALFVLLFSALGSFLVWFQEQVTEDSYSHADVCDIIEG